MYTYINVYISLLINVHVSIGSVTSLSALISVRVVAIRMFVRVGQFFFDIWKEMYVCTICLWFCLCMYACKYAYAYVYIYVCKYVYMYVCMCVSMYICTYVCMCVSMFL